MTVCHTNFVHIQQQLQFNLICFNVASALSCSTMLIFTDATAIPQQRSHQPRRGNYVSLLFLCDTMNTGYFTASHALIYTRRATTRYKSTRLGYILHLVCLFSFRSISFSSFTSVTVNDLSSNSGKGKSPSSGGVWNRALPASLLQPALVHLKCRIAARLGNHCYPSSTFGIQRSHSPVEKFILALSSCLSVTINPKASLLSLFG